MGRWGLLGTVAVRRHGAATAPLSPRRHRRPRGTGTVTAPPLSPRWHCHPHGTGRYRQHHHGADSPGAPQPLRQPGHRRDGTHVPTSASVPLRHHRRATTIPMALPPPPQRCRPHTATGTPVAPTPPPRHRQPRGDIQHCHSAGTAPTPPRHRHPPIGTNKPRHRRPHSGTGTSPAALMSPRRRVIPTAPAPLRLRHQQHRDGTDTPAPAPLSHRHPLRATHRGDAQRLPVEAADVPVGEQSAQHLQQSAQPKQRRHGQQEDEPTAGGDTAGRGDAYGGSHPHAPPPPPPAHRPPITSVRIGARAAPRRAASPYCARRGRGCG